MSQEELKFARGSTIVLPADVPCGPTISHSWKVPFNGTVLTLFNPLPSPDVDWRPVPEGAAPAWWRHPSGALTPAWNMLATVYDLLTFKEEQQSPLRDRHGRVPPSQSPRLQAGLTKVPVVNEALALLIDAAAAQAEGIPPALRPEGLIAPPAVVLSHDCDLLDGGNLITQAIRVYRMLEPVMRLKRPRLELLPIILANMLRPRRYYLDDLLGMLNAECKRGYRSSIYILNGTGGRFGARSSRFDYGALIERVSLGWEIGIHYNYDTFQASRAFEKQKTEIENLSGQLVYSGRAHYLRFDSIESPKFVADRGIRLDESIGWTGENGYRAGIAAPFHPLEPVTSEPLDLIELPLMYMDVNAARGKDAFAEFALMFQHLERIGGVLSILFHPGTFANPEQPELAGVYDKILDALHTAGARNLTPTEIVRIAADEESGRVLPIGKD